MPHGGRAAGQSSSHTGFIPIPPTRTESGMGAELILQPCRGQGKEAVSQQGVLEVECDIGNKFQPLFLGEPSMGT